MQTIKDGTTEFEVKDMRYKAIVDLIYPVGTVIAFAKDERPPVLKYGEWKEVPAGRFLQNAFGTHKAGETVDAGLPNITGIVGNNVTGNQKNYAGAFEPTKKGGEGNIGSGSGITYDELHFDASYSNSLYGSSETVQPPAYIVHFYERVK